MTNLKWITDVNRHFRYPSQVYTYMWCNRNANPLWIKITSFQKNHLFSGGKCDSCDEDERRRCATAIIVKWWNEVIIMVKLSFTIIKMAAVADSNDLTSNWRKIRLKPISLPALLSILILLLPQPQNAMPIPKIQQNSLTSAMVSFKINLVWNRSNQTFFKLGNKSVIFSRNLYLWSLQWFQFLTHL